MTLADSDGQFDDAPEIPPISSPPEIYHENEILEWSSSDEEGEHEVDEIYDDNRVEDEDWEIAERGASFSHQLRKNCSG
jgi:RIO kinase 1